MSEKRAFLLCISRALKVKFSHLREAAWWLVGAAVAGVLRHLIDMKLMYLPVIPGSQSVLGRESTYLLSFLHFVDEKTI